MESRAGDWVSVFQCSHVSTALGQGLLCPGNYLLCSPVPSAPIKLHPSGGGACWGWQACSQVEKGFCPQAGVWSTHIG